MKRREVIKRTSLGLASIAGFSQLPIAVFAKKSNLEVRERKIYLFSKHLQWVGYDEMAKITAEIGFDGLDVTVRPNGHVEPEYVERELPKAVEAAQKNGLEIKMITTSIKDADDIYTERILKTASELGIKFYRLGWYDYDFTISIPENIKKFGEALKKIGELNAKYSIIGDYQNHAGTSGGSPVWDIYSMLEQAGSTWLGAQYDIRHAMVEGMNSWPIGLRLLKPFIHTIDIKDFVWEKIDGKWTIQNVPLGKGAVDFKSYFSLLNELNIDAPICVHLEYPLGGADHGNFEITIPRNEVIQAMSADLSYLQSVM